MLDLERSRRFRQAKENLISTPPTPITFTDFIDWCHLVDRHRPTAWDTTRKLVVPQAVGADQPNDTILQRLGFPLQNVQNLYKSIHQ
ncbi:hypothetical protein TYRP_020173 [Tyrophagus putrescentiae]|nr:hypothetical protein TYRP_020173 [Tyrophagus putrescentiae]